VKLAPSKILIKNGLIRIPHKKIEKINEKSGELKKDVNKVKVDI